MKQFISIPNSKKGQIFGLDLMFGVIIILVGIMSIYLYSINFFESSETNLKKMHYDSNFVSSQILSEGYPINWTKNNVNIPGILTNNKINQTKLDRIYNFSKENYEGLQQVLNTKYDFYFNFSGLEITNVGEIEGIGKKINNPKNIIKTERYTLYKNKPIKFNLYIWN